MSKLFSQEELDSYRRPLPKPEQKRGIYFLFDHGEVVYVGQSSNFEERLKTHMKDGVKEFDSYAFFAVSDPGSLSSIETVNILYFQPIYNKSLPPGSGYKTRSTLKRQYEFCAHNLKKLAREKRVSTVTLHSCVYYRTDEIEGLFPQKEAA